jgi:hypothetical protein
VAVRPPRRLSSIVLVALTALAAVGCGGSQVSADEVPGPPPALTVPSDPALGGCNSTTTSSGTTTGDSSTSSNTGASTDTSTPADTSADAATGATSTDTSTDTSTGTTDTTTTQPGTTTTEPAPSSSESQQFEDFCAQNAGAC